MSARTEPVKTAQNLWSASKARPKRFLMVRQNWMAASENCGLRPRLPLAAANQDMFLSSQTVKESRALSAVLYCFQLVMR